MANRLRNFLESIVYAGMKPGARQAPGSPDDGKPGLLSRLLSAPAPSDPLYLSNQTFGQKLRRICLLAAPLVLLIGGVMALVALYAPKSPKPVPEPTPAEIAAKVLPNFNKEIKLDSNKNLEVLEVHFEHNAGNQMVGNMRNKSDHQIAEAIVVFDLADPSGSQLGGVTITETNLAPGSIRKFQRTISQATATYAVAREIRTQ